MDKTKIISIGFFVLSLFLAGFLGTRIYDSITESERIASMEAKVVYKLTMIREAQIAYQAVNGQFTSDWGKLKNFIDSGQFYLVSRTEHVITLDYGADTSIFEVDTLGSILVKDSIYSPKKYPDFDLATLEMVPGKKGAKFAMWADQISKSGVTVDVVEVWNTAPIDPSKKEDNEARNKRPLRFGSRTNVTTAGNWE